jgi:hypothetical protein
VHNLLRQEIVCFYWETKTSYLEDLLLLKLNITIEIERRIIMRKKLLVLLLCISVCLVLSAYISPVNAGDKGVVINWQIAGTIVQFIDISKPTSELPEYIGPHSMINLSAKGSPGPAKITLLSRSVPSSNVDGCPSAYQFAKLIFDKNDFIATFPDQSLLFATLGENDGEEFGLLCIGATGTYFSVREKITGGTGRFEGASGEFTGTGYGYFIDPAIPPAGSDNALVGENGTITGSIDLR